MFIKYFSFGLDNEILQLNPNTISSEKIINLREKMINDVKSIISESSRIKSFIDSLNNDNDIRTKEFEQKMIFSKYSLTNNEYIEIPNSALVGTALHSSAFGAYLLRPNKPRSVDLLPIFHTGVPNLPPYQLATGKPAGNPDARRTAACPSRRRRRPRAAAGRGGCQAHERRWCRASVRRRLRQRE